LLIWVERGDLSESHSRRRHGPSRIKRKARRCAANFPGARGRALVKIGKRLFSVFFPKEDFAMESKPVLSRDEYIIQMRQEMEEMLGKVADAINDAPAGYVISGSEEKVRDLFADLRRRAYEKGVQMRVNAAEAAFPPSEGLEHGQDQAQ
jgi:hypothetical protein